MINKVPSYLKLIMFSLRNFGKEHQKRNLYISVLLIIIIFQSFFHLMANLSKKKFLRSDSIMYLLIIINIKSMELIFGLTKTFLFEKHILKLGPYISAKLMKILLFTEQKKYYEMSPGQIEYNISEGIKAIGKISRVIIIDLTVNTLFLILDLTFIFLTDKTKNKTLSIFSLISIILIMFSKFYQVKSAMILLYKLNEISYTREKTYVELLENISIIKMYGEEEKSQIKYKNKTKEWVNSSYKYNYTMFCNHFLYNILGHIFILISTILYVGKNNRHYIEKAIRISSVGKSMIKSCSVVVSIQQKIQESITKALNIVEYIDIEKEEDNSNKIDIDIFNDNLEIKNLSYSIKDQIIFKEINMILNKGDKVALFGRNGSGKSSILKLILQFDDYKGMITIDGIDIRNLNMRDYYSLITYVPQDTRLFDDTIYSNLIFGHDRSYNDVIAECKKFKIHEKIMELKDGYNTVVGETGKNINGGLRQMIFYTRAFLRNTPIYLFDEPTNNLDVNNSKFLFDYIKDPVYSDKTFFVICHDIELVKQFSKIYFFDKNKLFLEIN